MQREESWHFSFIKLLSPPFQGALDERRFFSLPHSPNSPCAKSFWFSPATTAAPESEKFLFGILISNFSQEFPHANIPFLAQPSMVVLPYR